MKSSSSSFIFIPIDDNYEDEISAEEFCKTKKELEEMAIQVLYKLKSLEEVESIKTYLGNIIESVKFDVNYIF